jgi:hypothetical protein
MLDSRLVAIAGYGLQAAFALATVLLVSWMLSAAQFAHYSILLGFAQFGAILCFEWIRIGATRFYPGDGAGTAVAERRTIAKLQSRAAIVAATAAFSVTAIAVDPLYACLLVALATLQGFSDLNLTLVRYGGRLPLFTRMQFLRSFLLFGFTVAGAHWGQSWIWALTGIAAAHTIALGAIIAFSRFGSANDGSVPSFEAAGAGKYWNYGVPSAAASVMHTSVPAGLRPLLAALLGEAGAAGAILALDLMQKPFALIAVALNGIFYPEAVKAHQANGEQQGARRQLYIANIAALTVCCASLIAFSPEIGRLFIAPALATDFATVAPWLALLFAMRSIAQNVFSVRWHLAIQPRSILLVGASDVMLSFGGVALATIFAAPRADYLVAGAATGAALLCVAIGLLQLSKGEPLPKATIIAATLASSALGVASTICTSGDWRYSLAKLLALAVAVSVIALTARRDWRAAQ